MKVTIAKRFDFDAAHFLPHVPDGHKCKRMHGHTYCVEIVCHGEPDARGMVLDYAELADAWKALHDILDHSVLNEIVDLENPTTEVLAPWILRRLFTKLHGLASVKVFESSTTWCEATVGNLAR